MKFFKKTMAALQRDETILKQLYNTLANQSYSAVATIPLSLNPNTTNTTNSEQEFNYKMAAHDLISPLATQFTLLDIVREEMRQVLQYMDSLVISNSESLRRSKAALGHSEDVEQSISFKALIETIAQLLSIRELHKHVDIIVHQNTKKSFYNNVAMVQSIMQNLIQNAVKYSKPNQQNTITITVNDTKSGVEIIVQDTGIGMDKERVAKLFKQVVDEHKGVSHSHGFGLYGVAQYVEKLNGKITAASTLNVGSTFRVSLPSLVNS